MAKNITFLKKHAVLLLLFGLALAIRFYFIQTDTIYTYLPVREYRSALISRSFFFDAVRTEPDWRNEIARQNLEREGFIEPPIMETLVAFTYRLLGHEDLRVAKLFATLFWLIGGAFLYRITSRLINRRSGLVAVAYYLFIPMGIRVTVSFLPDPLMIMLFLISIHLILNYFERPTTRKVVLAGALTGLTISVKPLVVFGLMGGYVSLAIYQAVKTERPFFNKTQMLFFVISLTPIILYYLRGIFFEDLLKYQAQMSFKPHLWLEMGYWEAWFLIAVRAITLPGLLLAISGFLILENEVAKILAIGLGVGYLVFGFIFNHHISTHDYYNLQLFPLIAILFSPSVVLIFDKIKSLNRYWLFWIPVGLIFVLSLAFSLREVRGKRGAVRIESPEVMKHIGQIVNHSSKTTYISFGYGNALAYYGEIAGSFWPRPIDEKGAVHTLEERIVGLGFEPEYIIITQFEEYEKHHQDLKSFMAQNCALIREEPDKFLIYGQCLYSEP